MGGRGGISGLAGSDSPAQKARREAKNILSSYGMTRYDKVVQEDYGSTVINHYYKMMGQLDYGEPLKDSFSKNTADNILKKVKEDKIFTAKRILGSDIDDKRAVKDYQNKIEKIKKIEEYVTQRRSAYKKTETEKKTEEAKKYFREHYDPNREQREITSSTYKRAQNRMKSDVESFLGIKRRKRK